MHFIRATNYRAGNHEHKKIMAVVDSITPRVWEVLFPGGYDAGQKKKFLLGTLATLRKTPGAEIIVGEESFMGKSVPCLLIWISPLGNGACRQIDFAFTDGKDPDGAWGAEALGHIARMDSMLFTKTLVGMHPVQYRHARDYAMRLGFVEAGVIPNFYFMGDKTFRPSLLYDKNYRDGRIMTIDLARWR